MNEDTMKRLDALLQNHGRNANSTELLETLHSIIAPILGEFASELCARGFQARVETDDFASILALQLPGKPEAELSFRVAEGKLDIRSPGVFRGRVEAEAVDSVLVEEHVLAFIATVMR